MSNALDRIERLNNSEKIDMSLEEQLAAVEEVENPNGKDFFGGMSSTAREGMKNSLKNYEVTEVTLPKKSNSAEDTDMTSEDNKDSLFNNNTEEKKQHRGRPSKKTTANADSGDSDSGFDSIMNQLAKDVLNDLRKQKYTYGNFSSSQMKLIFNYIIDKL